MHLARRHLGLSALLTLSACGGEVARGKSTVDVADGRAALAQRVDALMAPLVSEHEFSGAVVIARHDTTLYERGFGVANHDSATAFTPDTPSDGASLAKTFTAAGVWWLVQEGKIDLDARVQQYIAEYPHAATSVHQLISHSNGLPDDYAFFDAHFTREQARTIEAMLSVLSRHAATPSFVPGTRFEYSSLGYDVAALLIERASGQGYEQFLRERFFTPLGMTASFVRPGRLADWRGTRTMGYRWRDTSWVPVEVFDMEAFHGGSNIYLSARDLSRWASAHAAGKAMPSDVLTAGAQRTVVAGQRTAMTGLNWYCDASGDRCYYTGDLNAFFSFVYWDRARGESVVYVSNSSLPMWRRASLARDLVGALAGAAPRAHNDSAFATFDSGSLAGVAGTYAARTTDTITISAPGTAPSGAPKAGVPSRLRLRAGSGLEYDVFPVAPDVLYVPGLDWWLAFRGTPVPSELQVSSVFLDVVTKRVR